MRRKINASRYAFPAGTLSKPVPFPAGTLSQPVRFPSRYAFLHIKLILDTFTMSTRYKQTCLIAELLNEAFTECRKNKTG